VLWGESAGAMTAGIHLINGKADQPFHKLILESNPIGLLYKDLIAAGFYGSAFAEDLGCAEDDLNCLRATSTQAVQQAWGDSQSDPIAIAAQMAYWPHPMDSALTYTPTIDGDEVPGQVVTALQAGTFHQVPMLIGSNRNEAIIFIYAALKDWVPIEVYEAAVYGVWPQHAEEILTQYYNETDDDGRVPFCRVLTDYLFACSQEQFAVAAAKARQPAWVYRYDHVFSGSWIFPKFGMPAECGNHTCHAAELPFVYHNDVHCPALNVSFTEDEKALSQAMVDYWTSFAHYGDPNFSGKGPTRWPAFDPINRGTLVLDTPITVESTAARCEFWDKIGYLASPEPRGKAKSHRRHGHDH